MHELAMPVFALSVHADYGCGHSGACCRTPWDVPVERHAFEAVQQGLADGRLAGRQGFAGGGPFVDIGGDSAMVAVLRRDADGACVLLQPDRLCAVHRALGADALPDTCRIFPRIALTDARGTCITLSHYCPTAARSLLRTDEPLTIVRSPRAFPPGNYQGLDASDAWPPTLRPGVLLGLDGYAAWEQRAVDLLGDPGATAVAVVARFARDIATLQAWRPGDSTLAAAVVALPAEPAVPASPEGPVAPTRGWAWPRYAAVAACVPRELTGLMDTELMDTAPPRSGWEAAARGWAGVDRPARAYLAAHAFANWAAYDGDGLEVWLASVEAALAVLAVSAARRCAEAGRDLDETLFVEAVREADLLLRHLATREALVRAWSGPAPGRQTLSARGRFRPTRAT